MIAYKVVNKETRDGSNWTMFINDKFYNKYAKEDKIKDGLRAAKEFKKQHPEYFPKYKKDTIVYAAPGSVGIMCFETAENAYDFIHRYDLNSRAKAIKVDGIGRAKRKNIKITCGCGSNPGNLTNIHYYLIETDPPEGTITFKSVKVLE